MTSSEVDVHRRAATSSGIPRFATVEEEAEFWDTRDSTEFEHEFGATPEDMRFVVRRPSERWIPLVLDEATMTALEEQASRDGTSAALFVRRLVEAHLKAS